MVLLEGSTGLVRKSQVMDSTSGLDSGARPRSRFQASNTSRARRSLERRGDPSSKSTCVLHAFATRASSTLPATDSRSSAADSGDEACLTSRRANMPPSRQYSAAKSSWATCLDTLCEACSSRITRVPLRCSNQLSQVTNRTQRCTCGRPKNVTWFIDVRRGTEP